jgi:hypothetical protein
MKVHAIAPRQAGVAALVGRVMCQNARDPTGKLLVKKGAVLDADAAARLVEGLEGTVHLLEMEPGELHEGAAGSRLAAAAAGLNVGVRAAAGGQWSLVALARGLLEVDVARLDSVNALEGVSVFTLYHGQIVDVGEVVGRAKVIPLVIPESVVREAERRSGASGAGGMVAVATFQPLPVGAVAPAGLDERARARFASALSEKLTWFGAPLSSLEFAGADPVQAALAMETCLRQGARVLVVAGANVLDPLDPFFCALERLGARIVRRGAPADPGSLLWLERLEGTVVIGVTSCGMFSQGTLFDLVLPRILAGEELEAGDLAGYGHGGLLTRDMRFRFPPYRKGADRGSVD